LAGRKDKSERERRRKMTEEEEEEEEEEEGCSRWISFECFFFSFLLWGTVKTKTDALVFFF